MAQENECKNFSEKFNVKIENFKKERLSMILSNEIIGDIGTGIRLILHIIPEWSFKDQNIINLKGMNENAKFEPISGNHCKIRYNADGFLVYNIEEEGANSFYSYAQIFHNGIIEVNEKLSCASQDQKIISDWVHIQTLIINAVKKYQDVLSGYNIPKPWYVLATMINAKDYITNNRHYNSEKIDRNTVNSLVGICNDEDPIITTLKTVLESLSHAFGIRESYYYNEIGEIKPIL